MIKVSGQTMTGMELILASTSIYRQRLLERAGLTFQAHAPLVHEDSLKSSAPKDAQGLTSYLAQKKAESLLDRFPKQWIIGCDQVAALDEQILGKPGSRDRAIAQLESMSGRWHQLVTSVAIVKEGEKPTVLTDVTKILMKDLGRADLEAYVDKDHPLDCAGSYKFEKAGIGLIEKLQTADPTAIEGLPMIALTSFFFRKGFSLAEILNIS